MIYKTKREIGDILIAKPKCRIGEKLMLNREKAGIINLRGKQN